MNPFFLPLLTALSTGLLISCHTPGTGVPSQQAVEIIETQLRSRVDRGIFGLEKIEESAHTHLAFIEGSRHDKADHAFPLRVTVTIEPLEGGSDSALSVDALKSGLKTSSRAPDTEGRWETELLHHLTGRSDANPRSHP